MKKKIKTILLGGACSGKTTIIKRFMSQTINDDYFDQNYDRCFKDVSFYIKGEEKTISLALWDTCGQERFRSTNKIFIKGSKIILLVYDLTRRNSLEQLNDFYKDAIQCVNIEKIVLGVIAIKLIYMKKQKFLWMKEIFSVNK